MNIEAHYKPTLFPLYRGNPLIEAIEPCILRDEAALHRVIKTVYELPDDIWEYDDFTARDFIAQLDDIYLPNVNAYQIYFSVIQQIKVAYKNRNPLTPKGQKYINQIMTFVDAIKNGEEKIECFLPERDHSPKDKAKCSVATGLSGLGKSETIESVLSVIPQVIRHRSYEGQPFQLDQLVWVSFDVTSRNSIKGLAMNFFWAVDEAIGSKYAQQYDNERNSVDVYIGNMRLVCAKHCIGFVHVDECQHLLRNMKATHSASVSDLESLFNRIGIPMLMTCTPDGMKLFFESNQNKIQEQLMVTRRLMSERVFTYVPMSNGSETYQTFFDTFLPDNVFKNMGVKTVEFRTRVHELTFGIHAVAARLLRLFFEVAVTRKNELLEGHGLLLLEKVYEQHFEQISKIVKNLHNGKSQEDEFESAVGALDKSSGRRSATMHSSRVAPNMASERVKEALLKEAPAIVLSDNSQPMNTGLFGIHS
jgi:hypothetical protein